MLVIEVVAGLLVCALAIVMAFAGVVGLLGILGAVRFARCDCCARLGVTSASRPMRSCIHCRHGWVLHPLYQWHRVHAGLTPPVRDR